MIAALALAAVLYAPTSYVPNACPPVTQQETYGSPDGCDHTVLPSHTPEETVPPVTDDLAATGVTGEAPFIWGILTVLVGITMASVGYVLRRTAEGVHRAR